MFFLRVDYIYRHSPVQRSRDLVDSLDECLEILKTLRNSHSKIIQVKIEYVA